MNQNHKVHISEHPAAEKDCDDDEMAADEDCDIRVPVANFRSNHIAKKVIDTDYAMSI
jgi:hypothetical protein